MSIRQIARGFGTLVAGLLGLLLLLGLALFILTRPPVAGYLIESALERAGYGPARIEVERIGLQGSAIADISLGPDPALTADRLSIAYRLPQLVRGRLDGIRIDGLTVAADLSENAVTVHLPGPDRAATPERGGSFDLSRLPPIELVDAQLLAETPYGPYRLRLDGALEATGPRQLNAAPDIVLESVEDPARRLGGEAVIIIDGGRAEAGLDLDQPGDEPLLPIAALDSLTGDLVYAPDDGLSASGVARLSGLAVGEAAAEALDLRFEADWQEGRLAVAGDGSATALTLADTFWERTYGALPPSTQTALDLDALRPFKDQVLAALRTLDAPGRLDTGFTLTMEGTGADSILRLDGTLGFTGGASDRPVRLSLMGQEGGLAVFTGGRDRRTLAVNGVMALAGPGLPDLEAAVSGRTDLAPAGSGRFVERFEISALDIATTDWRAGGQRLALNAFSVTAAGGSRAFNGTFRLKTEVEGRFFPWLAVSAGALDLSGRFDRTPDIFAVTLDNGADCGAIRVRRIVFSEARIDVGEPGLSLCPDPDRPFMLYRTDETGAPFLTLASRVGSAAIAIAGPPDQPGFPPLEGVLPGLSFVMDYAAERGDWTLDLNTDGGRVRVLPDIAALGPLDLRARLSGMGGVIEEGRARLASVGVRDLADPVRFAPLFVDGTMVIDGGIARLAGRVSGDGRQLATLSGRHNLASGAGAIDFVTDDLIFLPFDLQPQEVLPMLRGHVAEVAGRLDGTARLSWGEAVGSEGVFSLSGIEFLAALAPVVGVNGDIALVSLLPPLTDGFQTLTIDEITAPWVLADGRIEFALEEGGILNIREAIWPFAGGEVGFSATELTLDPAARTNRIDFTAEAVELAQFLPLLNLDGLSGEGVLDGELPVEIRDGRAVVVDGRLRGRPEGGVLSYRSVAAEAASAQGGEQTSLLFQALDNFHWDELELRIDGEIDGQVSLNLTVAGGNPDLYDGYPFRIRIRTEGALAELLRRGTIGFRLQELLEEAR